MRLYPRHRLDLDPSDLLFAARACSKRKDRGEAARRLEHRWSAHSGAIATLSVRSAFDLLLEALALPRGAELVMSAVTIPHMEVIARAHGLTVVPVPIEPATAAPLPQALDRAISSRTGAVLVAHLFGGRMNLLPLLEVCRERRVPLLEDCAQGYVGPRDTGHPQALASFFSFGSIKTATALGGALTTVRDPVLLSKMRAAHGSRPVQPAGAFARKVARAAAIAAFRGPKRFGMLRAACAVLGVDFERALDSAVKGFPGGDVAMLAGIRHRPSRPLLEMLEHRLETWDEGRLERRARFGERLRAAAGERMPGHRQPLRTHWLAPFLADSPGELISALREAGFDAAQGTTSLTSFAPASRWLESVVYLPAYPGIAEADVAKLCEVVGRFARVPLPKPSAEKRRA